MADSSRQCFLLLKTGGSSGPVSKHNQTRAQHLTNAVPACSTVKHCGTVQCCAALVQHCGGYIVVNSQHTERAQLTVKGALKGRFGLTSWQVDPKCPGASFDGDLGALSIQTVDNVYSTVLHAASETNGFTVVARGPFRRCTF